MEDLKCVDTPLTPGLYLLGRLDAEERGAFERHLARCAACQADCRELGPVVTTMGRLSAADVRAIIDRYGVVERDKPMRHGSGNATGQIRFRLG